MYNVSTIKTKNGEAYISETEMVDEQQYTVLMPESLVHKYKILEAKKCYVWNELVIQRLVVIPEKTTSP